MLDSFLEDRPSCIQKFEVLHQEKATEYSILFQLGCPRCKSPALRVLCYPAVADDGETYTSVEAGEIVERSPHHVECSNCAWRELLFDPAVHGFDGALGEGTSYERGEGEERPIDVANADYSTIVEFLYNIEFSELTETAQEAGVLPKDLFDGFAIYAISSDGKVIKLLGFECA